MTLLRPAAVITTKLDYAERRAATGMPPVQGARDDAPDYSPPKDSRCSGQRAACRRELKRY